MQTCNCDGKGNEQKYKGIAESLGLENSVVFTGVRHNMPAIYQAADLFVLLSGFDTFAMVVTEAMAAGLPVIISDQVGAKDLVEEGRSGFIVDRNDIEQIAANITKLIENHGQRHLMKDNARNMALKTSWNNATNIISEIYEIIFDQKAKNP